jgi:protein involved in polysaccharide export with SLBB domain
MNLKGSKAAIAIAMWAVSAIILSSCATNTAVPLTSEAAAARPQGEYQLGLGDKLRVTIFGERDLSGEYQVSGGGVVTMPLVGDIPVSGLTAREIEKVITEKYQGTYLTNPSVSVEVYSFRPFFVLGEVERPGSYPTQEGITILGAIATSGGYTYRANTKKVFLRRAGDTQEYEVDPNQPIKIAPGDVVRVGERHF